MSFFKRYKWYLVASLVTVLVFIVLSLWLFFLTNSPQAGPFEYQVN